MQEVDVASIVPSTRDLLQVLQTRRKNLALIGMIGGERAAEEAARLHDMNVSAFACDEPGPAMQLAARATKTVPSLCLAAAGDREALLRARRDGADGVCVSSAMPLDAWDRVAQIARTMRMLPVALAADAASVETGVKSGARAIVLTAATAEEIITLAKGAPRTILIGWVQGGDAAAIRALAGQVDAAVVPHAVHASPDFAELVAEVDP